MNPMSLAKRYLAGVGDNQYAQEALDYGLGALGVGGLTAVGNLGDGADQNVLLQGVLSAPLAANLLRQGRSFAGQQYINRTGASTARGVYEGLNEAEINQKLLNRAKAVVVQIANQGYAERQLQNPYMQAALAGSAAATVGGLSGRVFDNDATATSVGLAALGGFAPIAYSMLRGRNADVANSAKAVYNIPENSTGRYRTDEYHGVPSGYPRASANPDNTYQANRPDPTTPFRVVNVSTEPVARPSVMGALPYQRGGDLAVRDPNLPTTSRVVVPPLTINELALNTTRGRGWNVGKEFPLEAGLAGLYANSPRMR
jgi:hypothetical protein